jgi:hypothetical protein
MEQGPRLRLIPSADLKSFKRIEPADYEESEQCLVFGVTTGRRCDRMVYNPPYPNGHYQGWLPVCGQHLGMIETFLQKRDRRIMGR